jgi:hypothetical protein
MVWKALLLKSRKILPSLSLSSCASLPFLNISASLDPLISVSVDLCVMICRPSTFSSRMSLSAGSGSWRRTFFFLSHLVEQAGAAAVNVRWRAKAPVPAPLVCRGRGPPP